jgi:glycosyltransferase involved in cell wall biosynthesis
MANAVVLVFCNYYIPGFRGGGPIRTVSNMVDKIGCHFDFHIVTADRDLGDAVAYKAVEKNRWNSVGSAQVFYVEPGLRGIWKIALLLKQHRFDVLYLNSFFSFQFSIMAMLVTLVLRPNIPIILGPRGEFSAGALMLKALKKRIFIAFSKMSSLYGNVIWHASTRYEAEDIRHLMGGEVMVRTAIDLVMTDINILPVPRTSGGQLQIVFVSRISPKKNLLGVLSMLLRVREQVRIDVYGPAEDEDYWAECQNAAAVLPVNVVFKYCGILEPLEVSPTLAKYDLFLFPTLGENYGHVIAEALCAGLPILISDTTPWRNLEQMKLGWDIPLDQPDRFVACIEECSAKSADEYDKWRHDIRQWAIANIGNEAAVEENRQLFSNLV